MFCRIGFFCFLWGFNALFFFRVYMVCWGRCPGLVWKWVGNSFIAPYLSLGLGRKLGPVLGEGPLISVWQWPVLRGGWCPGIMLRIGFVISC